MTVQELDTYCKHHATSTSGREGICPQTISLLSFQARQNIVDWVNQALDGKEEALRLVGELARYDRMNLIPKTTEVQEERNLRPITVSPTLLRLLLEKIRTHFDEVLHTTVPAEHTSHQFGFKRKHGAKDLATVIQMLWETTENLHVVALDVQKAYDNVSCQALDHMMEMQEWPETYRRILIEAREMAQTEIWYKGHTTQVGAQARGAPESPVLFNSIMEMILLPHINKNGFQIQGKHMSTLMYADDILLL